MKKTTLLLTVLFILFGKTNIYAQKIEQQGWVTELNSGKKAMAGVEIDFDQAVPTTSDDEGKFVLTFLDKNIGDLILINQIYKKGYELVNLKELQLAKLNGEKLVVVMCKAGLMNQKRAEYYKISVKFITASYTANLEKLKQQMKKAEISQENFLAQIQDLNQQRQMVMKNAEKLAVKFSRINFDDVSDLYKRAFDQFKKGNIDGAITILEEEDLIGRAKKRIKERNRLQAAMKDLKNWKQENDSAAVNDMRATQLMIKSLPLHSNESLIDSLYLYLLKLDSTHIENQFNYAKFLVKTKHHNKARLKYNDVLLYSKENDYFHLQARLMLDSICKIPHTITNYKEKTP